MSLVSNDTYLTRLVIEVFVVFFVHGAVLSRCKYSLPVPVLATPVTPSVTESVPDFCLLSLLNRDIVSGEFLDSDGLRLKSKEYTEVADMYVVFSE